MTTAGVYEFMFGLPSDRRDLSLKFWEVLGFTPVQEANLSTAQSESLYGHAAQCESIRLSHPGCATFGTGLVRLHFWDQLKNEGLGKETPIHTGSRWMGLYCHDILQLRDSFDNPDSRGCWDLWMSSLVNAPLAKPAPDVTFFQGFVGLRETLVFGNDFRLAFIQRGGFDRPGFGTFDDSLAFKNTEGSHANIVQPPNTFSTDFYKQVFDFETAPFGEAHDSGDEAPTIEALQLKPGEMFRIERTRAKDCPSGYLQVYSSYEQGPDRRPHSAPGSRGLCCYSIRVTDVHEFKRRVEDFPGALANAVQTDEFGQESMFFNAPDGYAWVAVAYD